MIKAFQIQKNSQNISSNPNSNVGYHKVVQEANTNFGPILEVCENNQTGEKLIDISDCMLLGNI